MPQKLTALGLGGFGAYSLFRGLWVLHEGRIFDFMDAGAVHGLAFVTMVLVFVCIAFGLIWFAGALLQNELRKYERIISATPDLVLLVGRRGEYQLANDAACEYMNKGREAIVGRNSADMFDEEFYDEVTRPNLKKALQGETSTTTMWMDFPLRGKRYMALHYHPVPNEHGEVRSVAVSGRDITLQQMIQEDRQRIFTMSLDMLSIMDADGRFTEVNPAWEKTTGWTKDELVERSWT